MHKSTKRIFVSARASERLDTARQWLSDLTPGKEAVVAASVKEAADDLLRRLALGRGALFAIHRLTFSRLIGLLAAEQLAADGLAPASALAAQAVAARCIYRLNASGLLEYFADVATRPNFPAAIAATLNELRLNQVSASALRSLGARQNALAAILEAYDAELSAAGLADRAAIVRRVTEALESSADSLRFAGLPLLLLDVPVQSAGERELVRALARRAPLVLATVPAGDEATIQMLEQALSIPADAADIIPPSNSLARLQDHLFAEHPPPPSRLDESVTIVSAGGEVQECLEIARLIRARAAAGVPFDRIAVAVHARRYALYLKEALERAHIPAWFASGCALPEPGGRALLALLACAAEDLSARRFGEYLSLAQLPRPVEKHDSASFSAPEAEIVAASLRSDLDLAPSPPPPESLDADPTPIIEGTLLAPWRWERLLVDAAVIGGRDRWRRRLDGLALELSRRRGEADDDDPRAAAIERQILDLAHLRDVALPIIDELATLPKVACWSAWLARLNELTAATIRDRGPVLVTLAELEPMGPVGPVSLDEVRLVLADRLGILEQPPSGRRYGAIFVAPAQYLRGLEFDTIIVPGLTERVFPRKLVEDPILPDALRAKLDSNLITQSERAASERLDLRIVAGAAKERIAFTYPRVDLAQGRTRVPSFYALEILRAAEGRLPGFDELSRRAATDNGARLGWPAPHDPDEAIDEAEFDLAILDRLIDNDPAVTVGAAHYLLNANIHLARALRSRARRWLRRWTPADGLVDPSPGALAALHRHSLGARSYSPTALQNYSACPYRFFLQAIHRLQPREEAEAIELIDPLTRGALFHEVQFALLTELRSAHLIPVSPDNLPVASALLERALTEIAAKWRDELAPAIDRVWRDGVDALGADLREWLRRMAETASDFAPERFELAFGLADRHRQQADPLSAAEPVDLACGLKLRGSIDLVESRADGRRRITDHKTGRAWARKDVVVDGGGVLQPVLYALAAERLLGAPVESGRLYYCTSAGGYEERIVKLDSAAREAIVKVAGTIGRALGNGFLPPAPEKGECRFCDYRRVCGPYEETRIARKPQARLADLKLMREMP